MTHRDGVPDPAIAADPAAPWPDAAERARRSAAPPPPPPVTLRTHDTPARPRVEIEDGILGLSRVARGRFGGRLFTLFFVFVYTVIALNLVFSLLPL